MTEKEFEDYWRKNREKILGNNKHYQDAKTNFKMHSGADWILFGIPIVAGIVFLNNTPFHNELLSWAASAVVTVLCYALCVWLKSIITGSKSPDETEEEIKEETKKRMCE